MIQQIFALYNWSNGVIMIGIFAVVCVALIGILVNFMLSGKPKDDSQDKEETTTNL